MRGRRSLAQGLFNSSSLSMIAGGNVPAENSD